MAVKIKSEQIKDYLDKKVVGQENAKVLLSVLLSVHINRDRNNHLLRTPNATIIGPTGVGKTHTLRVAAEFLKVPFLSIDSTTLVPSGANGYQIHNILFDLIAQARTIVDEKKTKSDKHTTRIDDELEVLALAEKGILFFDEFDKIATNLNADNLSDWQRLVQRALLKITEGARLSPIESGNSETIDTSGILMLAGGAFEGLSDTKIRSKRPQELQRDLARSSYEGYITADLITYGFMPELVARLPVLIEFTQLKPEDLLGIINNSSVSPLLIWEKHFAKLGKELKLAEDAKQYLVDKAMTLKLGARGLQQILFPGLAKLSYKLEQGQATSIEINQEILKGGLGY